MRLLKSVIGLLCLQFGAASALEVTGKVEVEALYTKNRVHHERDERSDIELANVTIAFEHKLDNKTTAALTLLYEENKTDQLRWDEAVIERKINENFSVKGGRFSLPFGNFESVMVSDPLTLYVAESHESALEADYKPVEWLTLSLYGANGDTRKVKNSRDHLDTFGFDLTADGLVKNLIIRSGLTSNLLDSDTLESALVDSKNLNKELPAFYGALVVTPNSWCNLTAEYISAISRGSPLDFSTGDLYQPKIWRVELSGQYDRYLYGLSYQDASGLSFLDLQPSRYTFLVGVKINEEDTVKFEVYKENYGSSVRGQWAVAF